MKSKNKLTIELQSHRGVMFVFIIRTFITIIGIILGNLLLFSLQNSRFFDEILYNYQSNTFLLNSIYFGVVFCVAGVFFLASSVISSHLSEFEKNYLKNKSSSRIIAEIISLILGLTVSLLLMPLLNFISSNDNIFSKLIIIILYLMICAIITKFTIDPIYNHIKSKISKIDISYDTNNTENKTEASVAFLIDTNIFIDGRILKLAENHIITAKLLIPDFVLNELQYIADSSDDLLRKKGRRGLDILKSLQNLEYIDLEIIDTNKQGKVNVDSLLIKLAKQIDAGVFTNDLNLCKIAKIKNVKTININSLAIALKPEYLQGEKITVKPVKKGKGHLQALAYLDDGTMIVIEEAEQFIGDEIEVEVTESIQSAQGKMIFTKIVEG